MAGAWRTLTDIPLIPTPADSHSDKHTMMCVCVSGFQDICFTVYSREFVSAIHRRPTRGRWMWYAYECRYDNNIVVRPGWYAWYYTRTSCTEARTRTRSWDSWDFYSFVDFSPTKTYNLIAGPHNVTRHWYYNDKQTSLLHSSANRKSFQVRECIAEHNLLQIR